jgi:hypothetical protein
MDWTQVFVMLAGNAALIIPLFLWNRSESRSDHRHLEAMVNAQIEAIRQDMKDFHGRLCAIEEGRKK